MGWKEDLYKPESEWCDYDWLAWYIRKHDQRRFVCEGEGGYPYITNDIIGHRNFCSSKAAYDYLDFLDRFKLWDGLPITRIDVRVEQVLCLFSPVGGAYRDEERGV